MGSSYYGLRPCEMNLRIKERMVFGKHCKDSEGPVLHLTPVPGCHKAEVTL